MVAGRKVTMKWDLEKEINRKLRPGDLVALHKSVRSYALIWGSPISFPAETKKIDVGTFSRGDIGMIIAALTAKTPWGPRREVLIISSKGACGWMLFSEVEEI